MKVLFLGYPDSPIIQFLREIGEEVFISNDKINSIFILENKIDFIVSYGYRYLIKKDVLKLLSQNVINLHISYLPYNRGSDPNFWSFFDDSPKGITIHLVDEGLDTGDILVQKQVGLSDQDNLRTTYQILQSSIQQLFIENWELIRDLKLKPFQQVGTGSYHKSSDKEPLISNLKDQWLDIPIFELIRLIKMSARWINAMMGQF